MLVARITFEYRFRREAVGPFQDFPETVGRLAYESASPIQAAFSEAEYIILEYHVNINFLIKSTLITIGRCAPDGAH